MTEAVSRQDHSGEAGNARVLITGGTGSWGNELVSQLLDDPSVGEVVVYSRGEHTQVQMKIRFSTKLDKLRFMIGDVRDAERLSVATKGIDKAYHLAALKHVPVCEENPWEAVLTNIVGTNNLIDAAIRNDVRRVVFVSTDKAVDPLSLYGVTKSCAEKLVVNANTLTDKTDFICLRAGNVLGTNGSVVPLFIEQIRQTNTITLTDPAMTRFFLRVEDAIQLVLKAEREAVGGEIAVVKMPACRIRDLADVIIDVLGNESTRVLDIGIRPGEKLHEVLVSKYESPRVIQRSGWFVILPMIRIPKIDAFYGELPRSPLTDEYSSLNAAQLTKAGIRKLLELGGFFEANFTSTLSGLGADDLLNLFHREGWVRYDYEAGSAADAR